MVVMTELAHEFVRLFQYSLCRVVLMVTGEIPDLLGELTVSVLALSSRFDGPTQKGS